MHLNSVFDVRPIKLLRGESSIQPRQPHFGARPVAAGRVLPIDRDRVGHAARVPLDDGIGRVKISVPPFSGSGSPEDFLEWEMRLDHIFSTHHYT